MDRLLIDFAHAIAPGPTRAVANEAAGSLTVFVVDGIVDEGTVVVAQLAGSGDFVTGKIAHPSPGWVQIDDSAYPIARIQVRGPVLFTVRPVHRDHPMPTEGKSVHGAERRPA
jgi:hypothetical protein